MYEKNTDKDNDKTGQAAVPAGRAMRRRGRLRISRTAAVCAAVAALICVMSAGAFAATGGETANPIQAVRVMLNGESLSAEAVKADGSIEAALSGGDELSCEDPETGESVNVKMGEDGGSVRISRSDSGVDVNVGVKQDGSEDVSMNIGIGSGENQEDQKQQEDAGQNSQKDDSATDQKSGE